jgi:hypothetical protein
MIRLSQYHSLKCREIPCNILFYSLHLASEALLIFLHALFEDTIIVAQIRRMGCYFVQAPVYFRVLM